MSAATRERVAHPDRVEDEDNFGLYLDKIGAVPLLIPEEEVKLAKSIEVGLFAAQLLAIRLDERQPATNDPKDIDAAAAKRCESYTVEELETLAELGQVAYADFVAANTRLVVSLAKKYTDKGLSLDDLVQEGNLGMMHAVEMFDYTKGFKFSTYATWWIKQALGRAVAGSGAQTIRLPLKWKAEKDKIAAISNRYRRENGGEEITPEQLADELGISVKRVLELQRAPSTISYNQQVGSDDSASELEDRITMNEPEHDEAVEKKVLREQLRQTLVEILSERELAVIKARFGFEGRDPLVFKEIGVEHGVTGEYARQMYKDARNKIRARAEEDPSFAALLASLDSSL